MSHSHKPEAGPRQTLSRLLRAADAAPADKQPEVRAALERAAAKAGKTVAQLREFAFGPRQYDFNGLAGCVIQSRSRITGTRTGLYHAGQAGLPITWSVGIKDVLSGLSACSNGDGRNRSTVEHILLQEDLDVGRLHRKAGDFLCTSRSGSNGKQYAMQPAELRHDGDDQAFAPKVTCRHCLSLAARWMHPEDLQDSSELPL